MDRSRAIRQLPETHAVAIRLKDGGFSDGVIAVALGTEPEQVPPLLRIAATKLARLLAKDEETIDLTSGPCRGSTKPPKGDDHAVDQKGSS